MKREVVGWPSAVNERWFCLKCWPKTCERWCFTISEFQNFMHCYVQDHHSLATLSKVLCNIGSRNAQECTKNWECFSFKEQYLKDGDEFLDHIAWVTGNETWVSFVNVETREKSKKWKHTHSPDMPKNLNADRLPERWQLFPGTGKESWQWNSCNKWP
jgi:hypothetical protein